MKTRFVAGSQVRVIRNVRNDGTFPGSEVGELLVRRGEMGYVRDVGTFLQDQIIYSVHFVERDRLVGCREEELIGGDEPWVPSRFEFRDKVCSTKRLAVRGETVAEQGAMGEILKVLRDDPHNVQYHVRFPGRTLQVPESALEAAPCASGEADEPPVSQGRNEALRHATRS
ncbi:MAG: nitrogen fixation protein NifZ [Pseudomonadota bacterium]|nr:nitrogen fixation protein NifZ [Pseudomonadota bacterium]